MLRCIGLGEILDPGVCCKPDDLRVATGVVTPEDASTGDRGMRDPGTKGGSLPLGVSILPVGDGSAPRLGSMDADAPEGARSRLLEEDTAELLCADGASMASEAGVMEGVR